MATRSPVLPAQFHRAIVASGKNIKLDDSSAVEEYRRRYRQTQVWQSQAFYFNKEVPLIGFATDYARDAMSRIQLLPAIWPDDPAEHPVPLDDDTTPKGLDADIPKQILSRLEPFPEFMGRATQQLDLAGEFHVALVKDPDDVDREICRVLSVLELFTRGGHWYVRDTRDDIIGSPLLIEDQAPKGNRSNNGSSNVTPPSYGVDVREHMPMVVSEGGFFRIWQNDPEFWNQPYSHMIRLLSESDTLRLLTQMLRGIARSRIAMNGRILAIAEEFSLNSAMPVPSEDAGDGEARADPFIDDLMQAATAAILEPESAAAALPLILRAPMHLLKDGLISLDLDRKIDDTALQWREELRKEIAYGVNLPPEIILGLGATNHWNAEEIKDQVWRNHLEPRAMNITAGLTEAFFRPQLIAAGVDPKIVRRCCVWYDPAWFIGKPDLATEADAMWDRYEISGDYYRQIKGAAADSAPDLDEVKYRLWIKQQERVTTRAQATAPAGEIETTPQGPGSGEAEEATPGPPGPPGPPVKPKDFGPVGPPGQKAPAASKGKQPETVPETPVQGPANNPKQGASLTAAASKAQLAALGKRLAGIERDLRARLQAEANATVARALERAGAKVMDAAKRKNGKLAAQVRTVTLAEVPEKLGEATVHTLGLGDHELLDGAVAKLGPRFKLQVKRAQHAAAEAAARAAGIPDEDVDYDNIDEQMDDDRDHAWTLLSAGLMGLLLSALYAPHPQQPEQGEFDESSLVPAGLIRSALDVAGGADIPTGVSTQVVDKAELAGQLANLGVPSFGATGGPGMQTIFADSLNIGTATHTWVYGDAIRKTFEPHLNLDGVQFTQWDDPQLANEEGWPPVDFYSPGDHAGCQCDVATEFTDLNEGETEGEAAA